MTIGTFGYDNFGYCLLSIQELRPEQKMEKAFQSNFKLCLKLKREVLEIKGFRRAQRYYEDFEVNLNLFPMENMLDPRERANSKPMNMDSCLRKVRTEIFAMKALPSRHGRNAAAASLLSSRKGNRTNSQDLRSVTDLPHMFLAKKEHFVIKRFDHEE